MIIQYEFPNVTSLSFDKHIEKHPADGDGAPVGGPLALPGSNRLCDCTFAKILRLSVAK